MAARFAGWALRDRGAHLVYRAGGAGGTNFPGSSSWKTALGLYWSHEHATRIVTDPNSSHVWLITERASFREFKSLASGSGLRLYQAHVPSDENRKLYYDTSSGGWQLDYLDGRKDYFLSNGLWDKTVWAQNPSNPTQAHYNGSNQLTSVDFPDGRSETYTYATGGKLDSITEVPVSGSGTSSRTWSYVWSGDELTEIHRPDSTTWKLTYDATKNGGRTGYVTRIELIGTDGVSSRVEQAFEYDSHGNVIKAWKGDTSYTGTDAVNRQELAYTSPSFPTSTDVKEWIDATQSETTSYAYDRDPVSIKTRVNTITGDCPVCGTGPNSSFTYGDSANPLLATQVVDGRGLTTQYAYNSNGKMTSKTEAAGTSLQRLTTWQYSNSSFPGLTTQLQVPSTSGGTAHRTTTFAYDTSGNLTTQYDSGSRRWEQLQLRDLDHLQRLRATAHDRSSGIQHERSNQLYLRLVPGRPPAPDPHRSRDRRHVVRVRRFQSRDLRDGSERRRYHHGLRRAGPDHHGDTGRSVLSHR